jgi:hypothetical protein
MLSRGADRGLHDPPRTPARRHRHRGWDLLAQALFVSVLLGVAVRYWQVAIPLLVVIAALVVVNPRRGR